MSATPDPASLAAAQQAAATAAERFVAATDASYDERTDLIQAVRMTAAQLEAVEQAEREAGR